MRTGVEIELSSGPEPGCEDINGVLSGRSRAVQYGMAFVWLLLIVVPFSTTLAGGHHRSGRGLNVAGVLALTAIYLYLFARYRRGRARPARYGPVLAGLLVCVYVISLVLTLASGPDWGFLFTYCVAPTALSAPKRIVPGVVIGTTVLAGAVGALAGASSGNLLGLTVSTAGVGLLMLGFLLKDAPASELATAIRRAVAGEVAELAGALYLSPEPCAITSHPCSRSSARATAPRPCVKPRRKLAVRARTP